MPLCSLTGSSLGASRFSRLIYLINCLRLLKISTTLQRNLE